MSFEVVEIENIDFDECTIEELMVLKAKLYKRRDEIRLEIMKNGNETFQKYGSEFTYNYKHSIEKLEKEIEGRFNGSIYNS